MPHGVAVPPSWEPTASPDEENKSPLFTPRSENEQPPPIQQNAFTLQTPARFEQPPGYFAANSTLANVHPGFKYEPSDDQSGLVVHNNQNVPAQVAGPSSMIVDHPYQQLSRALVPPSGYAMNSTGFTNGTQSQATGYHTGPGVYHQHQPQILAIGGPNGYVNPAPGHDVLQRRDYPDQQGTSGGLLRGYANIPHGHWHGVGASAGSESLRAVPVAPVSPSTHPNAGYDHGDQSQVARIHPALQQGGFAASLSAYQEQQRHAIRVAHFRRAAAEFERRHAQALRLLSGQAAPSSTNSHIAAPDSTDTHAQAPGESSDMSMNMSPPRRPSHSSTGNQ
ncbi:hypothetical protein PLICRDRAFT_44891 [Plicaturopsis crispa FD-325 SS-3]|nr:hypothetical protein PLICRDRAFT_44891 [Plicaturopsis crispa FD-325 SS-3]